MQKRWMAAAAAALILTSAGTGAWAATSLRQKIEVEYRGIQIKVDGEPVTMDAEPFVYLEKGRTFVPARPLAEALGAKVGWDEATNSVQVYTKSYVESKEQDGAQVWSMPARGFQFRTPLGFERQGTRTGLMQLILPADDGFGVVFTVDRFPSMEASLKSQAEVVAETMEQTYPDVKIDESATEEEPGRLTLWGTMQLGDFSAKIAIRLVDSAAGDWALVSFYPASDEATYTPMVKGIMNSFTEQ